MSYKAIADNIYAEGTLITAKENPSLKLKIARYYKRIYYCSIVGDDDQKQVVYYERELIPPVTVDKGVVSADNKQIIEDLKPLRSSMTPDHLVLTRSSKKFEVINRAAVGTPIIL